MLVLPERVCSYIWQTYQLSFLFSIDQVLPVLLMVPDMKRHLVCDVGELNDPRLHWHWGVVNGKMVTTCIVKWK